MKIKQYIASADRQRHLQFAKWSEWPYAAKIRFGRSSKDNRKVTYDKSRTEMMLKVFHSRITESTKIPKSMLISYTQMEH